MILNNEYLKFFIKSIMNSSTLIFNEEVIRKRLYSFDSSSRISLNDNFFTKSAVLFTIIPYTDKPYNLVLIHRTNMGLRHRGEMSFPGGKFDPKQDKTLKNTALRETEEEIGVSRNKIKILGCLHDFPTMTRYIITPFVAIINKNQKLIKDVREVQEILQIPIDFFVNKQNFREQAIDIESKKFPIFYFNYVNKKNGKKYTIWGATAHIIATFIEEVYDLELSALGLKRFKLERIKHLKDYIKYKKEITSKF